uniref:Torsin-1A C-terminal domain-containing protein n=1 Tax=Gadus morhua TaxID=8049 RepID=A0A8C5BW35_GADMO
QAVCSPLHYNNFLPLIPETIVPSVCYFLSFSFQGLEDVLKSQLLVQHIASEVIMNALTGFMNNDNPNKPLVLSFHGTTGTGKNLASQLIVKNIYKKGMDSRFVHYFNSVVHFPYRRQVETYKTQLQHWIRGNVTNCAHSMFIFADMDKMHPGLIDCIKPFMVHRQKLDGVSYRKAIFIFLSNAGGEILTQTTLDFWKAGKDRQEIKLKDVETALSSSVFNNHNSGLWHSSLIESSLVDFFIPFLPLEHWHVVQCIMDEMEARGLQPDPYKAFEMADEIVHYFPQDEGVFSVPGCKTIASRLRNFM